MIFKSNVGGFYLTDLCINRYLYGENGGETFFAFRVSWGGFWHEDREWLFYFLLPVFDVPRGVNINKQTHTTCMNCFSRLWGRASPENVRLILKLQKVSIRQRFVKSQRSESNGHSHANSFPFPLCFLVFFFFFLTWSMNYLMACTVSAQTLNDSMLFFCVRSFPREWTFLQLQGFACQNLFPFPFFPALPLLFPATSIIPASSRRPQNARLSFRLCSWKSLRVVVRLGLLYFGVKSWHCKKKKKSMLKRIGHKKINKNKTRHDGRRRACGTFADGNQMILVPSVSFCCKCCSC